MKPQKSADNTEKLHESPETIRRYVRMSDIMNLRQLASYLKMSEAHLTQGATLAQEVMIIEP